jgi:hypothetical protein
LELVKDNLGFAEENTCCIASFVPGNYQKSVFNAKTEIFKVISLIKSITAYQKAT